MDSTLVLVDSIHYSYDKVGNRSDTNATVQTGRGVTGFGVVDDDPGRRRVPHVEVRHVEEQTFLVERARATRSMSTNGVRSRMRYDEFGRRICQEYNGFGRGVVYDGEEVFLEFSAANNVLAAYTFYPGTDLSGTPHGSYQYWTARRAVNESTAATFKDSGS